MGKDILIYDLSREYPSPRQSLEYHALKAGIKGNCVSDQSIPILKEGPWTWNNHERMQASEDFSFVSGVSGTAVIDKESELIYAIAQIVYSGDDSEINSPCEVDPETGKISNAEIGQSYTTPVAPLYDCYNQKTAQFDFLQSLCDLNIEE